MKVGVVFFFLLSIDEAFLVDGRSPKRIHQRNRHRGAQQQESRTKGNEGKGKGYSGDVTDPPQTTIAPTDGTTGDDFEVSNDGSHLDLICGLFQSYNDLVVAGGNSLDLCSSFNVESSLLCPNNYELGKVCDGVTLGFARNVSVIDNYCVPLFDEMYNDSIMKDSCIGFCEAYVNDGDCCALTCND
jgi:hypothetical protein